MRASCFFRSFRSAPKLQLQAGFEQELKQANRGLVLPLLSGFLLCALYLFMTSSDILDQPLAASLFSSPRRTAMPCHAPPSKDVGTALWDVYSLPLPIGAGLLRHQVRRRERLGRRERAGHAKFLESTSLSHFESLRHDDAGHPLLVPAPWPALLARGPSRRSVHLRALERFVIFFSTYIVERRPRRVAMPCLAMCRQSSLKPRA